MRFMTDRTAKERAVSKGHFFDARQLTFLSPELWDDD